MKNKTAHTDESISLVQRGHGWKRSSMTTHVSGGDIDSIVASTTGDGMPTTSSSAKPPLSLAYRATRRVLGIAVLLACVVGLPRPVSGQSITSWTLRVYNQGAQLPLSTTTLLPISVMCNQAPPAAGPATNPSRVVWDDGANAGKVCIWTDPGTGPLFSVPFGGTYDGTLAAINSAGTSPESVRAPFTRPGSVPASPSGLRFLP